jgi:endonuclease/exonuclease/phosphatase family metal-dependent hydrolase
MLKLLLLSMTLVVPLVYDSHSLQSEELNVPVSDQGKADSNLLEVGQASKILTATGSPAEIKVVSYNIRWRGGKELRRLAQLFKADAEIGGATILGLQEVDRNKKRTGNENTAKMLAEELGMYYAWAAPPSTKSEKEEETGVAILSAYPLSQVQRIVLPHQGPGQRRRVALGATVTLGKTSLRIYSVHGETRISVDRKLAQMKAVLEDLDHHPKEMPSVVVGDFNTWEKDAVAKTFKLFTAANFQTPFDEQATFFQRILFVSVDLKLDWIWLRNVETSSYGINRRIELSDHWPLWVVLKVTTVPR